MTEQEFFDVVAAMPVAKPVQYRLYHDESGRLLFYSMEDLPGSWIEVDQEIYMRSPHRIRVVDGQLHELEWRQSVKLRPSQTGTPCHPRDVTIIYDGHHAQYWNKYACEQN